MNFADPGQPALSGPCLVQGVGDEHYFPAVSLLELVRATADRQLGKAPIISALDGLRQNLEIHQRKGIQVALMERQADVEVVPFDASSTLEKFGPLLNVSRPFAEQIHGAVHIGSSDKLA